MGLISEKFRGSGRRPTRQNSRGEATKFGSTTGDEGAGCRRNVPESLSRNRLSRGIVVELRVHSHEPCTYRVVPLDGGQKPVDLKRITKLALLHMAGVVLARDPPLNRSHISTHDKCEKMLAEHTLELRSDVFDIYLHRGTMCS